MVAKGFTEKFEDEASTCSDKGLKMVLVVKNFGWRVRTLHIKTVYLQGREMIRQIEGLYGKCCSCLEYKSD